jgi:hypothetical protein
MRVQHKALLAEFRLETGRQKCIIMYMHLKKLSNSYRTELIKKKKERLLSFFNFRLRHYLPRHRTASILFISYGLVSRWSFCKFFTSYGCCTLLIRSLPTIVARWGVAAHQIVLISITGQPATDLGRGPPDHLCVMTEHPAIVLGARR